MADPIELNRLRETKSRYEAILKRIKDSSDVTTKEINEITALLAVGRMKRLLVGPADQVLNDFYNNEYMAKLDRWKAEHSTADPVEVNSEAKRILEATWGMESLRNVHTLSSNKERMAAATKIFDLRKSHDKPPELQPEIDNPSRLKNYAKDVKNPLDKMRENEEVYEFMVNRLSDVGFLSLAEIHSKFKSYHITGGYVKKKLVEDRFKTYTIDGSQFGVRIDNETNTYSQYCANNGQAWKPPVTAAVDFVTAERELTKKLIEESLVAWRKREEKRKQELLRSQTILQTEIDFIKENYGDRFLAALERLVNKQLQLSTVSGTQLAVLQVEIQEMKTCPEFFSYQPKDKWELMRFCISKDLIKAFAEPVVMASQDLSNILSIFEAMIPANHAVKQYNHKSFKNPLVKMSNLKLIREIRNAKSHQDDFSDDILVAYIDKIIEFLHEVGVPQADIDRAEIDALKQLGEFGLKQALELDPCVSNDIFKQSLEPRPIFPRSILELNTDFTGRRDVLDNLRTLFSSSSRSHVGDFRVRIITQAVKGLGGIGKTEIAKQYCRTSRDHYKETGKLDLSFIQFT